MTRTSFFTTIAAAAAAVVAKAQGIIITPGTTTFGPPTDGGVYKRKLTDTDRLDAIEKYMLRPHPRQEYSDGEWVQSGWGIMGDAHEVVQIGLIYGDDLREVVDAAIHKLEEE